ncbi:hypothetical protein PG2010B_0541 [Bifidobacterium animalis subsp. lactis]|nr:hypothetical protein PG2007B_0544 [Bifidobacterium animalis subsp. lactis]RYM93484.1 hypothetical protein PG2010B_0541 [Bifidobacterium animalis subsp. lactis]
MGILAPVIMVGMEMSPHQYSGSVHDFRTKIRHWRRAMNQWDDLI